MYSATKQSSPQLSDQYVCGVFPTQGLQEANIYDLYGYPIPLYREFNYLDNRAAWSMDYWPERHITQWTISQLDIARRDARYLAETHPEASGILTQISNYTIGAGSMVTYVKPDEEEEPEKGLEKACTKIINKFRRINMWECLELEAVLRMHRDGEYFLRLYPDEDGVTKVRFVEPVQIRPPQGEDHNGPWSWGVYTPGYDNYTPEAFNVYNWHTAEDEEVPAQYIVHHKINCTRNNKRGFSSFYSCYAELDGARGLRFTTRESEKARAAIAFIRQHAPGTTSGQVAAFRQGQGQTNPQGLTDPALDRSTLTGLSSYDYQKVVPGTVRDIPNGMEYKEPPKSPNAESSGLGVTEALRSVAARFGVPYWMVSGDTGDANFASALVAESPLTVKILSDQRDLGRYTSELHNRVLSIAAFQDQVPLDVNDEIAAQVAFKSPVVRNNLEETKRRLMLVKEKLMSQHTACAEEGLDYELEQAHIKSEPELPSITANIDGKSEGPETASGERSKLQGAV